MKKWISVLVLGLLIGCGRSSSPPPSPHTLRMNISRDPLTLDPRKGNEWISSALHFMLFEGLMRLNPDGTLAPAQARSVEISDDRTLYTFHLRGTRWSDGSAVTAKDFELAWKKIIDPQFGAPSSYLLYPIKNGEKIKKGQLPSSALGVASKDDLTLVVELEKPTPYFLDLVSFCLFFPVKHALDQHHPKWMQEATPHFISNGPFTLQTWEHNREIVLKKNKRYWEAPLISLDEVHVSMIADENTALNMYENGQLDVIGMVVSPIPTEALHHFYQKGVVKNQSAPATTIVTFNTGRFPFNNKHIRKALSYAIDRSQIVENVTQLGEEVATNVIPSCLTSRGPYSYFHDHDIEKAQEELSLGLQELALAEFPKLTLQYSFSEIHTKIAQVLQEQWKKTLGIEVQLEKCEHKILLDRLTNRNYDLATAYWYAQYKDPMSIFERFMDKKNGKNYPDWENPEYTRLLEKSIYDATPEERAATLAQAESILIEEMPIAPLYHWQTFFMMKDNLTLENLQPQGAFDYARISVK